MTSPPRRRRRPQLTPPVLGLSVHKVFNDPKADVVLKCRVQGRYRNSAEIPEQAFKVQKSKLQAHSSIFQDMFELANPMNETFEGLPFVKLAETATTMEVVLGFVYNLPKPVRKVQELDWTETRAVWEAANKYEMYTLRNFASDRLAILLAEKTDLAEVSSVLIRAQTFEDQDLASMAFKRATHPDVQCTCNMRNCVCTTNLKQMPIKERLQLTHKKINSLRERMDQQRKETYKNLFQVRSGQGYTHSNAETSLKELDTRHEAQFDKLLLLLCSA